MFLRNLKGLREGGDEGKGFSEVDRLVGIDTFHVGFAPTGCFPFGDDVTRGCAEGGGGGAEKFPSKQAHTRIEQMCTNGITWYNYIWR